MQEIKFEDIISTISSLIGNPKSCVDSLVHDASLNKDLAEEIDKLVSVMLVEVIKHSAKGKPVLTNAVPLDFLMTLTSEKKLSATSYTEALSFSQYVDNSSLSDSEKGYLRIAINLYARREMLMSASLFSCYFLSIA